MFRINVKVIFLQESQTYWHMIFAKLNSNLNQTTHVSKILKILHIEILVIVARPYRLHFGILSS